MRSIQIYLLLLVFFSSLTCLGQQRTNLPPIHPNGSTPVDSLPSLDLYGAIPYNGSGAGFGFGFFSRAFDPLLLGPVPSFHVRFGFDFYFLQTASKRLGTMPLSAPQTGEAKVSLAQENMGLNGVIRFTSGHAKIIKPYLDLFVGMRMFATDLHVTPLAHNEDYESSSSRNLATFTQWNYGATAGLLIPVSKRVNVNVGFMYTSSTAVGEIIGLKEARIEGGSLVLQNMRTPVETFTFKVGVNFRISKGKSDCGCACEKSVQHSNIDFSGSPPLKDNQVNILVKPSK
jgi:hypothetical protein